MDEEPIWWLKYGLLIIDVLMARKTELNRTRKCPYVGVVFDNVIALYKNAMFSFEEINIDAREIVSNDRNDLKGNTWVKKKE